MMDSILWRRLDIPGHEIGKLVRREFEVLSQVYRRQGEKTYRYG
jgi:hypothetical protein